MTALKSKENTIETSVGDEVQKRYLAYALSTIVSRALPDVRDGLKPVHRRILYAMHGMGLAATAKMRKSAAVVGEVIGKYHPHGDQAAYDALVRMAQDFSLRYPLVEGSGNFGSVDGDSPAAMRYTETRVSSFADLLLREIDQSSTEFRPTYDAMGMEPEVLPSVAPNLLLNGASGIAVGMSCSFAPHNISEVIGACRAMIKKPGASIEDLLKYIKGPDFPTAGETLNDIGQLKEIYSTGRGAIRLRGAYEKEDLPRGKIQLVITSIPYSVNKARLIERIANLIREKKLPHIHDVRDESAQDIRIVLELKGKAPPESIMAFLYKHTDLQINYPINMIAITPEGTPELMGLAAIIRHFLDFRLEKTTLRLRRRLEILEKRIHILEGFAEIFRDLDLALKIIRSARSRKEAEEGLRSAFSLDDEQIEAVLETKLYRLVAMEMARLVDELASKKREAADIRKDLASEARLWKIVDKDLADVEKKFRDKRLTAIVTETEAAATEYDPEEFVEHEEVTIILSRQGWIRRIKSDIDQVSSLKFRESDELLGLARISTDRTVALFTNLGKLYVLRGLDIPQSTGFGEPLDNLFNLADGELVVGMIAPDPVKGNLSREEEAPEESERELQQSLFKETEENAAPGQGSDDARPPRFMIVTGNGQGFRFERDMLMEPTKRTGRRFVNLKGNDRVLGVDHERELIAIVTTDAKILAYPSERISLLSGPAQGVRLIMLAQNAQVAAFYSMAPDDQLILVPKRGKERVIKATQLPTANRGTRGKVLLEGLKETRIAKSQGGAEI